MARDKKTGTKLLVGIGGLLLAMVGAMLTWDTFGSGGSGGEIAKLREAGTVTVASLSEAVYYVPEGGAEKVEDAKSYALELVYSRSEGVPYADVVADETKLPSKAAPVPPPPFATANEPTPEEATARARFMEAEEPAFNARTVKFTVSADKKAFDDAQPMDRHDVVYLKDDPAMEPRRFAEVRDYTASTGGPVGIAVLLAGLAMMVFGVWPARKAAAA